MIASGMMNRMMKAYIFHVSFSKINQQINVVCYLAYPAACDPANPVFLDLLEHFAQNLVHHERQISDITINDIHQLDALISLGWKKIRISSFAASGVSDPWTAFSVMDDA
mgnify:CR=1 FL=1